MWQNIAIAIIGVLTVIYIGRKVYILFKRDKHSPKLSCQGCCGCSINKVKKLQ